MKKKELGVILLLNVGHRDIEIDSKKLIDFHDADFIKSMEAGQEKSMRHKGRVVRSSLEVLKERISLPIISKVIGHILNRENKLSEIVLFATNQKKLSKEMKAYESDTEHCGHIIKSILEERYPTIKILLKLYEEDAGSYDEAMAFYANYFKGMKTKHKTIYINISGGTPPCNTGLLVKALNKSSAHVLPLYLNGVTGSVEVLRVGEQLESDMKQRSGLLFARMFNFQAVEQLFNDHEELRHLAAAASNWIQFDFGAALSEMDKMGSSVLRERSFFEQIVKRIKGGPTNKEFLKELAYNLFVYLGTDRLLDALARMYRLYEAILYYIAEQYLLLRVPQGSREEKERAYTLFEERVLSDDRLANEFKLNGFEPRFSNDAVLFILNTFGVNFPGASFPQDWPDRWKTISKLMNCLTEFKNIRNNTIVAHAWNPVNKNLFIEVGKTRLNIRKHTYDRFLEAFRDIVYESFRAMGIEMCPAEDTVEKFKNILIKKIEEYV